MPLIGSEILVEALRRQGLDTLFYLMGGPMIAAERVWIDAGLRAVDVRHEESAAMMAHAYARVSRRPGLCMAASGPGTANLVPGVANACADGVPLVAVGGSAPLSSRGRGAFQEIDQVAMMRPVTRFAEQITDPRHIPDTVGRALRECLAGPGPVYLDLPADILYRPIDAADVRWADAVAVPHRPRADPALVEAAARHIIAAERPIVVSGSGVIWSDAGDQLRCLVEMADLPLFTTPQGRGALPEDHPLCPLHARSVAFREADLVVVVGTRLNWIVGHGLPPRFDRAARMIQIDHDPVEIGHNRAVDVGLAGDAAAVLEQLCDALEGSVDHSRHSSWLCRLHELHSARKADHERAMATEQVPVHPLRLCREVRDILDREAVLVVDGHEILNFARQSIPTHVLGHRLNSGTFGTMGVGLPYALGARVAAPRTQVVALLGDGSFGLSAMELDTAVRHGLDVVVVISNNGGWTSAAGDKPGRDLGFTRYDRLAEALGCQGEQVERPGDIRAALERALAAKRPALVNVITDPAARSETVAFASYEA